MKGRIKRSQTYQLPVLPSATSYQSQGTYPFSSEILPRLPDALPSPPPLSPDKSSNPETMSSNGEYQDGYPLQSVSAAMEIRERKTPYQSSVKLSNCLFATNTNGSSAPITAFEEIVDTFSITSSGTSFSTYTQNSTIYPQASQGSAFASIPHLGLSPSPSPSFPSPTFSSPVSPLFTSVSNNMHTLGASVVRTSHPHPSSSVGSRELAPHHLPASSTYGPPASVYGSPVHDSARFMGNGAGINNEMGTGSAGASSTKDARSPFHSSLFHSIPRTLTNPGNPALPRHSAANATAVVTTTSPVPETPSVALTTLSSPYSHLTSHAQPPSPLSGVPVHVSIQQTWAGSSHPSAVITNPESGNMKNSGSPLNASLFLSCAPPRTSDIGNNNTSPSLFHSIDDPHLHNNTPTNNASTGNFDRMRDLSTMENSGNTVVNSPAPTESSYPFSPDLPYLSPSLSPSFSLPPSISRKPTRTSTQPGISHNYLGMSHFPSSQPYHSHMYGNGAQHAPCNEFTLSKVKKPNLPTYNEEIPQTLLSFTHYDGTSYRSLPSYDLISLPDTTLSASNTASTLATFTDATATTAAAPGALAAVPAQNTSATHATTTTVATNTAYTTHVAVSAPMSMSQDTLAQAGDHATRSPLPTIALETASLTAAHTKGLFASSQTCAPPRGSDASAEAVTPRGSCAEDAAAGQEHSLYSSALTVRVGVGNSDMRNFANSEVETMSMCSSNSTTTASYRTPSHSPTHSTLSPPPSLFGMGSSIYGTASSAFGANVSTGTGAGMAMAMGVWSSSSGPAMPTLFHNSTATTTGTAATIDSSGFGARGGGSGIMDTNTSISTNSGNDKGNGNSSGTGSGSGKIVGAPVRCNTFNTIVLTRAYRHNSNDGPDGGHGDLGDAETHPRAGIHTHTFDGAPGSRADSDGGDVCDYEGQSALSIDVSRAKQGDTNAVGHLSSPLSSACDPPHPPHSSPTLSAITHSAHTARMPAVGHYGDFSTINAGNNPTVSYPTLGIMNRKANMTNASQSSQNSSHTRNGNLRKSGMPLYPNNPENGKFRKSSPRLETHIVQFDSRTTQNLMNYSNPQPKYNFSSGNATSQSQSKPSSPSPFSPFQPVSPSPRQIITTHAQNTTHNSAKTPSFFPMPAPQLATPLMTSADAPCNNGCGSVRADAAGVVDVDSASNMSNAGAGTSVGTGGGAWASSVGTSMSAGMGTGMGMGMGTHGYVGDDDIHVHPPSHPIVNTDMISTNLNTNNTSTIASSHPPHSLAFLNTASPYMQPTHPHSPAMSVGGMSTTVTAGLTNISPSALSVSSHSTHSYAYHSPSHSYQHTHNTPHIHAPGHAQGHIYSHTPPYTPYMHLPAYSPSYSQGYPQSHAHAQADGPTHTHTHGAGSGYGPYSTSLLHGSSHGYGYNMCTRTGVGALGHIPPSSTYNYAYTHAHMHTPPSHPSVSPTAHTLPSRPHGCTTPQTHTLTHAPASGHNHDHNFALTHTHIHGQAPGQGQRHAPGLGLVSPHSTESPPAQSQPQPRGTAQGHARTHTNGSRAQRSPNGSGGTGSVGGKRVATPVTYDAVRTLDTPTAATYAAHGAPTTTTISSTSSACAMSPLVLPALAPFIITKVLTAYREEWDGFEDVFRSNAGKKNGLGTGPVRNGKDGEKEKEKDKGRSIFIAAPALPSPNCALRVHPPSLEVSLIPHTPSSHGVSVETAGEAGSLACNVLVATDDGQTRSDSTSHQAVSLSHTTADKTATEMRVCPANGTAHTAPAQAGVVDIGGHTNAAPTNTTYANVGTSPSAMGAVSATTDTTGATNTAAITVTTSSYAPLSACPSASPSLSPRATVSALIHTMQQTQTQLLEIREEMNNGKPPESEKQVLFDNSEKSESESPQKQVQELISTHIQEITGIITSSEIHESNASGVNETPCSHSGVTSTGATPADRCVGTAAASTVTTATTSTPTVATMTDPDIGCVDADGRIHVNEDVHVRPRTCEDADTDADDGSDTDTDMDSDSDADAETARTSPTTVAAATSNTSGGGSRGGRVTGGRMQRQYTTVLPRGHNSNTATNSNTDATKDSTTAVVSNQSFQNISGVQPVTVEVSGRGGVAGDCSGAVTDTRRSCAHEPYTSSSFPASIPTSSSVSSPSPTSSYAPPLPPFLPPSARLLSSFAAHINTHDTSLPPITTPVDCTLNCLHAHCNTHTGKKAVCINTQCPVHALEHSGEQKNGCAYEGRYGDQSTDSAVLVSPAAGMSSGISTHKDSKASSSLSPCVLTVKVYVVLHKRSLHLFINPLNGPIFPTAATPTPAALTLTLTHVPTPVHVPVSVPVTACDSADRSDSPCVVPPVFSAMGPACSTPSSPPMASSSASVPTSTSPAAIEARDNDNSTSLPCICHRLRCVCRPLEDTLDDNSNKTDDAGNKSATNMYKLEEVEPLQFTIPFTQNTMMKYTHVQSSSSSASPSSSPSSAPSEDYYYYHFLVFASSWRLFLRQITDRSDALYYLEQRRRMEQQQASDKQPQQQLRAGEGAVSHAEGREESEQKQRWTEKGEEMRRKVKDIDTESKRRDMTLPPSSFASLPSPLSPSCPSLPIPTFALTLSLGPAVTYTRASLHGGAFTSQGHVLTGAYAATTITTTDTAATRTDTRSNDGVGGDRRNNSGGKANSSTTNISSNGTTVTYSDPPVVHPGVLSTRPPEAATATLDVNSLALASKTASAVGANRNGGLGGNSEGRHPKKSGKLKIPGTPQISPVSSHSPSSASFFPTPANGPPQGRKHATKHTPTIAPNQVSSSSPYPSPSSSPSAGSSPLSLLEAHLQHFAKKIQTYVRSGGIDEAASVLQQALRACGGIDVLREVPAGAGRDHSGHHGNSSGSASGCGGVSSGVSPPTQPQTHTHPRIVKNTPSAPPHEWQVLPYHCMDASASLSRLGFDINDVDAYGRTLLMFACVKGMSDVAQLCLKYGADIYAVDKFGQTCLLYALKNKHHVLAEYLLLYPMDVSHVNLGHFCPLVLATMNTQAHIVSMIVDRNADVNTTVRGKSLLLFSVIGKHQDISALLVRNDATLNTLSVQGTTPKSILQWAVDKNMCNLVLLMLKHGARVKYYYQREVGAEEKEHLDETREEDGGTEKLDTRTMRRREKERGRDKKVKDGKEVVKEGGKDTTLQSATLSSLLATSPAATVTTTASVEIPPTIASVGNTVGATTTTSTGVAAGSHSACALSTLVHAETTPADHNDTYNATAGRSTHKSTNMRVSRVESSITIDGKESVGSVDARAPQLTLSTSNARDNARDNSIATATNPPASATSPTVLSRDGAGVGGASEASYAAVMAVQETVEIDMVSYAIKHNNSVIVKHLCESGLVDLHWSDALHRNYIMYSALHNKADLVSYFIDKGVDVYQVSLVYDEHLARYIDVFDIAQQKKHSNVLITLEPYVAARTRGTTKADALP